MAFQRTRVRSASARAKHRRDRLIWSVYREAAGSREAEAPFAQVATLPGFRAQGFALMRFSDLGHTRLRLKTPGSSWPQSTV
jgi:hypothetical protein